MPEGRLSGYVNGPCLDLIPAELSPTQQAEHLAKRKELWGARNTGTDCSTRGRPKEFASESARASIRKALEAEGIQFLDTGSVAKGPGVVALKDDG